MQTKEQVQRLQGAVEKINKLEAELNKKYLEREKFNARMIDAIIMRQHLLAIGPPGTGKSDECLDVADCILETVKDDDGKETVRSLPSWKYQFQKFTTLSEVFGAFSVVGMKEDRYYRYSANRLPEAKIAVMEEFFKSNSATLNGMLGALNERHWFDEGQIKKMPLRSAILNSNELPSKGDGLAAVEDRICLRVYVGDVEGDENFDAIMDADDGNGRDPLSVSIHEDELDAIREAALTLKLNDKAKEARRKIRNKIKAAGIYVSVRRWKMASRIVKCFAVRSGATEVDAGHLSVLEDCLWNQLEEREVVTNIVTKFAAPWREDINDLNKLLAEAFTELKEIESGGSDTSNVVRIAKKVQMTLATAKEITTPAAQPEIKKVMKFAASCKAQAMALVERSMA